MDLGSVPTWVAVVVATVAAGFAYAAWRRERNRDEDRVAERRRSQASLVAGWVYPSGNPVTWVAAVRNASELPVFDVVLEVVNTELPDLSLPYRLIEPGETYKDPIRAAGWGTLDVVTMSAVLQVADDHAPVAARTSFRDNAGIRWTRDEYGRLDEASNQRTTG